MKDHVVTRFVVRERVDVLLRRVIGAIPSSPLIMVTFVSPIPEHHPKVMAFLIMGVVLTSISEAGAPSLLEPSPTIILI